MRRTECGDTATGHVCLHMIHELEKSVTGHPRPEHGRGTGQRERQVPGQGTWISTQQDHKRGFKGVLKNKQHGMIPSNCICA